MSGHGRQDRRGAHLPKTARHPMIVVTPTPELQRKFNQMKDLQQRLTLSDKIEMMQPSTAGDGYGLHLQPPDMQLDGFPTMSMSGPGSPSMARSLSGASSPSTEPNDSSRPSGQRARRRGPLNEFQRARTSFTRKLKACQSCHTRRVRCEHHDLSLLEQAYEEQQRQAQTSTGWPSRCSPAPGHASGPEMFTFGCNTPADGTGERGCSSRPTTTTSGQDLVGLSITATLSESIPSMHMFDSEINQILGYQGSPPAAVSAAARVEATPIGQRRQRLQQQDIPLGKLVEYNMWECQYEAGNGQPQFPGSQMPDPQKPYTGMPTFWPRQHLWPCGQKFKTESDLLVHFQLQHLDVEHASPTHRFKCRHCCIFFSPATPGCPQCSSQALEYWYLGRPTTLKPDELPAVTAYRGSDSHGGPGGPGGPSGTGGSPDSNPGFGPGFGFGFGAGSASGSGSASGGAGFGSPATPGYSWTSYAGLSFSSSVPYLSSLSSKLGLSGISGLSGSLWKEHGHMASPCLSRALGLIVMCATWLASTKLFPLLLFTLFRWASYPRASSLLARVILPGFWLALSAVIGAVVMVSVSTPPGSGICWGAAKVPWPSGWVVCSLSG